MVNILKWTDKQKTKWPFEQNGHIVKCLNG